jgi:uncharacterized membrane protein YagU involved in acid resistance
VNQTAVAAPSIPDVAASHAWRDGVLPGALAGIIGGIAFGASMIELGALESIASLVNADTPVVGAVVHMTVAVVVGAVFGLLMFHQRATAADMLVWGTAYGAFFWFVGPLTLRPLILGEAVAWDIRTAHEFFGSLIGHIVWGAVAGLSLAALRSVVGRGRAVADPNSRVATELELRDRIGMMGVGGLAGLVSALILTALLPTENELTAPVVGTGSTAWLAVVAVGVVTGALYGALVPYSTAPRSPRLGARLVQGITLGYLAWIVVALTIVPLDEIDTLAWTAALARERFDVFPGYLLFGVLLTFLFCMVAGGARFLFSDELRQYDRLTAGPQRLRAVIRGAVAGIVGGLLFTTVMVQVGALGRVSRLVGAESPVVGFFVHMVVAVLVGVTYALLFRRHSFDVRSGLGWGVAYGLLWWFLGALTLLPVLLGGRPQWDAGAAARAFPSLVGHLVYGMGLGVAFYLLEDRHNPWWITRSETEAERTRARREQMLTSAPALWAFVVFVAFFVAVVLARVGT